MFKQQVLGALAVVLVLCLVVEPKEEPKPRKWYHSTDEAEIKDMLQHLKCMQESPVGKNPIIKRLEYNTKLMAGLMESDEAVLAGINDVIKKASALQSPKEAEDQVQQEHLELMKCKNKYGKM